MGIIVDCSTGNISEVVDAAPSADRMWASIRLERNSLLAACDWTQLPDAPVNKSAWAEYRQALRDITNQSNPFEIVWPEEPSK